MPQRNWMEKKCFVLIIFSTLAFERISCQSKSVVGISLCLRHANSIHYFRSNTLRLIQFVCLLVWIFVVFLWFACFTLHITSKAVSRHSPKKDSNLHTNEDTKSFIIFDTYISLLLIRKLYYSIIFIQCSN